MRSCSVLLFLVFPLLLIPTPTPAAESTYDPLKVEPGFVAQTLDLTVHDVPRSRDIPLRVYLPASKAPAPVILFSHGLGGSRENGPYLGQHWAARGYVVVFMQHAGSDAAVWRDAPVGKRKRDLERAASLESFLARAKDVPAVLDQLTSWNRLGEPSLKGRLDLEHVGMSGHSFGAITTQAVSGQSFRRAGNRFTDPRIDAAIAFSPSKPKRGNVNDAFSAVQIPWLLMTGTEDESPIGNMDVASRLAVFPALPPGNKYEVVLFGAEHSAFGDRNLPGERGRRNPNHHRVILALGTAFWDTYLRGNADALNWLDGQGPAGVLEPQDRWQKK